MASGSGGSSGTACNITSNRRIPIKEFIEKCREEESAGGMLSRPVPNIQKKSSLFAAKDTLKSSGGGASSAGKIPHGSVSATGTGTVAATGTGTVAAGGAGVGLGVGGVAS